MRFAPIFIAAALALPPLVGCGGSSDGGGGLDIPLGADTSSTLDGTESQADGLSGSGDGQGAADGAGPTSETTSTSDVPAQPPLPGLGIDYGAS
ncbi:MAG: hypothetical protein QF464_19755, partial [Myxococcota bacterium]|nr:hypothetical protein [Myxococcota bacterium]